MIMPGVLQAVLVIPAVSAGVLALVPGWRLSAALNAVASLATLAVAASLFFARPAGGLYFRVDDLSVVFIVLSAFVGFTTSIFSASYIAHEVEIGRLTPLRLRFYHAMYQVLMFAMNLALIANNIGLMWVAIELATLTTVMMVAIYRTDEAIEAAWKYFILGSVGIALALFGTILVYVAAGGRRGAGRHGVDESDGQGRGLRSGPVEPGVRLPDSGLRHQGRARPAACLATRRPRRRPDADLGRALGPPAQCRPLCGAALQDAAGRQS
jgi:formate hydrogenlyase subunit 3/multisubunit Na+/H+ antiporter MnhD subunit